jgi:integrase
MTVEKALQKYELHLTKKGNRRKSIAETIRRLNTWLDDSMPAADVTETQIQKRYDQRCEEVAVDSHRNELAEVKTFWRWCVKSKFIRRSPAERIEATGKRRKGKKQLRRNEAKKLFRTALELAGQGDEGAVAVLAVIMLGLRSGEIRCRKIRDVDADEDGVMLWIDAGKTDAASRHLDVPEPVAGLLVKQADGRGSEEWLFPSPTSSTGYREQTWLLKVVRRICKAAGVPRISVHGLRGTWATLTAEAGVSGHVIARELGHTSYKTTQEHYTKKGALDRVRTRRMLHVVQGGKAETHKKTCDENREFRHRRVSDQPKP